MRELNVPTWYERKHESVKNFFSVSHGTLLAASLAGTVAFRVAFLGESRLAARRAVRQAESSAGAGQGL